MADDAPNPMADAAAVKTPPAWSQLWQLPVLGVGLVMLALGVYLAKPTVVPIQYGERLDAVEEVLRSEDAAAARDRLNELAELGIAEQDRPLRARYRQYLGDHDVLEYQRVYPVPVETPASTAALESIDESYATARDLGRTLDDGSKVSWAQTLVLLGRDSDALAVIDDMGRGGVAARYETLRGLINRHRTRLGGAVAQDSDADGAADARASASAAALAGRYRSEPAPPATPVAGGCAGPRDAGGPRPTPRDRLHQPRDAAPAGLGRRGRPDAAGAAGRGLPQAEILLGQAELELAMGGEGYDERALSLFARAADGFPLGDTYIDAMLGRGHAEAMQRRVADAVDHFGTAITQLIDTAPVWDPRRKLAIDRVSGHVDLSIDLEAYDDALDYLGLLRPLFESKRLGRGEVSDEETLPPRMLRQFAEIHEQRAEQYMAQAKQLDPVTWTGPGDAPEDARRTAFQEAVMHFTEAAGFYQRHAAAVTVIDDAAYGDSLWRAATSYDRAEQWTDAISVYGEYVANRPGDGDGQQLEARHHLGLAYLADRQHAAAADVFEKLVDENPSSNWAYASLVPMALSFLETEREDKALRTLLSIVDGHPGIRPDSDIYREALIDLARLYYRRGGEDPVYYASAIERLTTAVQRYGVTDRGPELRYMLADALRQSASGLGSLAADTVSDRERQAMTAESQDRLRQAEVYFDQVIVERAARTNARTTAWPSSATAKRRSASAITPRRWSLRCRSLTRTARWASFHRPTWPTRTRCTASARCPTRSLTVRTCP